MRHVTPRVALAAVLLPAVAHAQPRVGDNFLGGRVVERAQVYVVTGYPDVETGVRLRLGRGPVELTPRLRFGYPAGGFGHHYTPLALTLGLDLRVQVLDVPGVSGALVGSLPVHLGFRDRLDPAVGVGLLHPGFLVTIPVAGVVDLDFGLQFQDDLWFDDRRVVFVGAVPFIFGVETEVVDRLAVGMRIEGGPAFTVATDGRGVGRGIGGRVRAVVGIGWSF